jgi:multisubunit Na+/H+ antiporter MnhB subunit
MDSESPSEQGRQPRRPRHFAPYRLARFIVVVLVLIGVAALTLLVLGLANVEFVTDHFQIH